MMAGVAAACLALLAGTGTHLFTDSAFTLAWLHSVEKVPWEEDYSVHDGKLIIKEARIKRSGAGMEPPTDAIWSYGWWHFKPALPPLESLSLANSSFAAGYTICVRSGCVPLERFAPRGQVATLTARPCKQETDATQNWETAR
jgi:hypothetical protein